MNVDYFFRGYNNNNNEYSYNNNNNNNEYSYNNNNNNQLLLYRSFMFKYVKWKVHFKINYCVWIDKIINTFIVKLEKKYEFLEVIDSCI